MRYWLLTIFLVVLAAACVSQTIEDLIKVNSDVSGFRSAHPNASVRVELVNNITAPSLYDEIFSSCPDVVEKSRYWKVSLFDAVSNSSATVWVSDVGTTVCKITAEGKIEVVEMKPVAASTSTVPPGPKAKGEKCSADSQCSTSFCSDGYCANRTDTPGRFSSNIGGGGGGSSTGSGGSSASGGGSGASSPAPTTTTLPSSGPNLVPSVDEIYYNSSVLRVRYLLKNSGDKPASNASMLMAFGKNGTLSNCTYITPLLEVGATHSALCYLYPSQGYVLGNTYAIGAIADSDWLIPETNELDNNVTNENVDTSLPSQSQTTTTAAGQTTTTAAGQTTTTSSTTTTTAAGLKAKGEACSGNSACSSNFCYSGYCADPTTTTTTSTSSTTTTSTTTPTTTTTTTQPGSIDLLGNLGSVSKNGLTITVPWEVRNNGAGNAGAFQITVRFVNSDTNATVDSCVSSQSSLAGGSLASGTCIKTMPSAGTYGVQVNADSGNQVTESDEQNNVAGTSTTVS